jgi:hypothetical protein
VRIDPPRGPGPGVLLGLGLFLFLLDKLTRAGLIVRTACPILPLSGVGDRQETTATKGDSMTMTKAKMITRIRSMQKEMGQPPVKAKTLKIAFSKSEVRDMYFAKCRTYKLWVEKNWVENDEI